MSRATYIQSLCLRLPVLLGLVIAWLAVGVAQADPALSDGRAPVASLNEEVLRVPGDPSQPVTLEVTFYKPSGPGPFPLAVMNHGATHASSANRGERDRFTIAAYYFLSRGYAVALPMMRGFAGSGGEIRGFGCDLETVANRSARDINAVIAALALRPDVDGSRVVVAGQSFGGWNSLGEGANPAPGVRGLIGFSPALRSSDCPTQDASMVNAAGKLGARTTLPSLWFYGENDTVMPNDTWRNVFDAYRHGNAHSRLVNIGRFKTDSHQMLSSPDGMTLWTPEVDAFLASIGLPSTVADPGYLPTPAPAPTHFAGLADVAAVPFLTDRGRAMYGQFLDADSPRVFVIGPNGAVVTSHGGYDPLGRAMRECMRAGGPCRPYAVNDNVVWDGPKQDLATLLPRIVARSVHHDVSTSLATFFNVNPDCSLRELPRLVVEQRPTHGTVTMAVRDAHPSFPANSPFAGCNLVAVSGNALSYTPEAGYSGADSIVLEKTNGNGVHEAFRFDLTIM